MPISNQQRLAERMRKRIVENLKSLNHADDETDVLDGDHVLNGRSRHSGAITPAAVLVPLIERNAGLHVLLTQRAAHLNKHAGQVSFPGGRSDPEDAHAAATALRETEEEVGITPNFVEVVGRLDDYQTGTGFRVTPIVGFVRPEFQLSLQTAEVATTFEVPLQFIFDKRNHAIESRPWQGGERRYYIFRYQQFEIWGATAGMLINLYRRCARGTGQHGLAQL